MFPVASRQDLPGGCIAEFAAGMPEILSEGGIELRHGAAVTSHGPIR